MKLGGHLVRRKMSNKSNSSNNSNSSDESVSNNALQKPLLSDFDSIIVPKVLPIRNW